MRNAAANGFSGSDTKNKRRTQRPYSPRARRFVMLGSLVREMELPRLKVGVVHGVQLVGGLAGQRRHVLVHVRQGGPDVGRRPALVGLVIHTDQVFFFHGKESRSVINIASTAISAFWALLMVGIVALAMFLTFVQ